MMAGKVLISKSKMQEREIEKEEKCLPWLGKEWQEGIWGHEW